LLSLADDPTAGFVHPKPVERNKARLSASGGEGEIKQFLEDKKSRRFSIRDRSFSFSSTHTNDMNE
jgi:hypothetical protein